MRRPVIVKQSCSGPAKDYVAYDLLCDLLDFAF
jgi:hypothetical protein